MKFVPLTLANQPPLGRPCVVYGSLSGWNGPGRFDVAHLWADDDGVLWWMGGRFRCEARAGGPAVVAWAALPPAADVAGLAGVVAATMEPRTKA